MNSQEAKFILQAYRHHGADASDPHFREALAQVERDPELAQWLEEDQRLFQLVQQSLNTIPVPSDLKANILAGGKIVRPQPWWTQPSRLAMAALVALLLTWSGFWMSQIPTQDHASFRADMSSFLDHQLQSLDEESGNVITLQAWLAGQNAPTQFAIPAGLKGLPSLGCKVLEYHGQKVSLVCFRDGATLVHLFVINQPDWEGLRSLNDPLMARSGSWNTASWAGEKQAFLLASKTPAANLKKYL